MDSNKLVEIDLENLENVLGIGIAGNFAGHLEQAGESTDFIHIDTAPNLPKGIFPWYVPNNSGFLGKFPLSNSKLTIPPHLQGQPEPTIQLEPELAVLFDLERGKDGLICAMMPLWVTAFDDTSYRKPSANKISEKKNWGSNSKGVAGTGFEVNQLDSGELENIRIACFLNRAGTTIVYGVDSAVTDYSLFGRDLLDWLVDRLNHQEEEAGTPLENVGDMLNASGAEQVLVAIGATQYTEFGENNFVKDGDIAINVVYDATDFEPGQVAEIVAEKRIDLLKSALVLTRDITM